MDEREQRRFINELNNKFVSQGQAIQQIDNKVHQLGQHVNTMNNRISSKQHVEEQVAINAAVFDKMNAYLNIIIFSGYAGFFAIWSFTNDLLPEKTQILTALLIGVSLFFFVAWEVLKSMLQSIGVAKAYKLDFQGLQPEEYEEKRQHIQKENRKRDKLLVNLWPLFAIITVVTGLGGGALLAYNFFASLFLFIPSWPI